MQKHTSSSGPDAFSTQVGLAKALLERDDAPAALAAVQCAHQLCSDSAQAFFDIGVLYYQLHENQAAMNCFERAIGLEPELATAFAHAARILIDEGYLLEAENYLQHATQLDPHAAWTWAWLARARQVNGKTELAIDNYRAAVELAPDDFQPTLELSLLLLESYRLVEATEFLESAVVRFSSSAELRNLLGAAYEARKLSGKAQEQYQLAVDLNPNMANAWCNLGNVFGLQARLDEALAAYRRALKLQPDLMWAHSNLVCTMLFHSNYSSLDVLAECRRWNSSFAMPLAEEIQPWQNSPILDRPLRIGYVSPDMCAHPVGRFMLPILESHDTRNFSVYVYSSGRRVDATTQALRNSAHVWREVSNTTDEDLANLIRQDQIDILVDLSMHMAHHRLLVFARKPAPIQVTYLAYVGTTGLDVMDYRLTDPYLEPNPQQPAGYTERSLFLSDCYWCYRPALNLPVAAMLPADRNQYVTLGSMNNFCKVTPQTLSTWCEILGQIPSSRLRISTGDDSQLARLKSFLSRYSIDSNRVETVPHLSLYDYFDNFKDVDVMLDTFPYAGGTTTCDALWMGVPVVSLAGQTAVGRGGLSLLSNIGLQELVATDVGQYVNIARELCLDISRIRELRRTLRNRMSTSTLMDANRFTRNLEQLFRGVWQDWCEQACINF